MRKIIVVYNPRSSKYSRVESEVLGKVRGQKGFLIGKFEIQPTTPKANAKKLAEIIGEGDLVLAAGGDGTATITLNGVVIAREKFKKEAVFSCFPYGNFNDLARVLGNLALEETIRGFREGEIRDFYPLEIKVNKKWFWYSGSYFTMGMFAESTQVFEDERVRKKLRTGEKGLFFSARNLFSWFMKNKKRRFLGEMRLNGAKTRKGTTDYIASNGGTIARVVRVPKSSGGKVYFAEEKKFFSGAEKFTGLLRLIKIGFFEGILRRKLPGKETERDLIEFLKPEKVFLHAEGEAKELEGVREVLVSKLERPIKVIQMER